MNDVQGFTQAPPAAQMFGGAGREYRWKYGTKKETFGKVSEKARKHAVEQPVRALQQAPARVEEIMASEEVFDPLTRYQCCPPTCGAAAAVALLGRLREEARHREPGLDRRRRR